jgi:predicted esterase
MRPIIADVSTAGDHRVRSIETTTHGRYLIDAPAGAGPHPLLVGFHGYGENADTHMAHLRAVVGDRRWLIVSVQALGRFYTRGDTEVVACWMTRQDRELAIADNIAYVAAVVNEVRRDYRASDTLVYAGFSQGAAMAYRAAAFAGPRAAALILLAGDLPPDVAPKAFTLPPILLGRGATDAWYTEARAAVDREQLTAAGVSVTEHVFDAGHVWHPSFIERAGAFLEAHCTK